MHDNGFREVMLQKTDEELLEIIQNKRGDYQEKAIWDIENILKERGVDYTSYSVKKEEDILDIEDFSNDISVSDIVLSSENENVAIEPKVKTEQHIYGPLVVGIIMVLFAFINIGVEMNYDDAMMFNIMINIGFRVIVLFWTSDLVKKYELNKAVWLILGLLFGGWQLIAINIAIWMVPQKKRIEMADSLRCR